MMSNEPSAKFDDPGSLDGVHSIRIESNDMALHVQADPSLIGRVRLVADAGTQAPVLIRHGDELLVQQQGRYRGGRAAVLLVPTVDCPPIEGNHDRGEFRIEGVEAPFLLQHGLGDIHIVGGSGELTVASGKSDISVEGRSGPLAIKLGMGDVRVVRSEGLIALSVGKGDVQIDSADGDIAVKTGIGDVTVSDSRGSLTVKSGSGDLVVTRPRSQALTINSGSGDVNIRNGNVTALRVKAAKGDVSSTATLLYDRSGRFEPVDVEAELDDLTGVEDFQHEPSDDPYGIQERLRSKGVEFVVGEKGVRIARGPFEFEASEEGVRFGKGSFSFVLGEEGIRIDSGDERAGTESPFDVQTGKGDIAIDVPATVPVRVEAIVNGGDVSSDIPLVSVGRPGPRGTTQRFVGVTGSPTESDRLRLRVRTDRGDIRIRSVQPVPTPPSPPRARAAAPPVPPEPPRGAQSAWRPAPGPHEQPTQRVAPPPAPTRDEQIRAVLEALSRGDLSISDAERRLAELERET